MFSENHAAGRLSMIDRIWSPFQNIISSQYVLLCLIVFFDFDIGMI